MDYRWVGYTVFELKDEAKKEEKEKPASTKNDGGEDESDKRNKEQRSVEGDISRVYILPSPNGGPLCPCKKHLYAGVPWSSLPTLPQQKLERTYPHPKDPCNYIVYLPTFIITINKGQYTKQGSYGIHILPS